VGVAVSYYM